MSLKTVHLNVGDSNGVNGASVSNLLEVKEVMAADTHSMLTENVDGRAVTLQGCANRIEQKSDDIAMSANEQNLSSDQLLDNNAGAKRPVQISIGTRVLSVNLFKNNQLAKDSYKLEYVANGTGKLNFGYEHIDSVEKTYGICLLGFVLNGKPPAAALLDLVKRWGSNIQFQTHEYGWITFTFPSVELKEKVLNGGSYKVYGHHLFLKEMPRCFRFREEDLTSFPVWVQIHGLPPDCWSFHILSNIVSRIGQPVHVDMLTFDRKKKTKYARVLVDIDTSIQRIDEMIVGLPIGDVEVKFIYEIDIKTCKICKEIGHNTETCARLRNGNTETVGDSMNEDKVQRNRSRSAMGRQTHKSRGRSRINVNNKVVNIDPVSNQDVEVTLKLGQNIATASDSLPVNAEVQIHAQMENKPETGQGSKSSQATEIENGTIPPLIKRDKGKKPMEPEMEVRNLNIWGYEKGEEGLKAVISKKQQKKKNKIRKMQGAEKSKEKGRQPKVASVSQ